MPSRLPICVNLISEVVCPKLDSPRASNPGRILGATIAVVGVANTSIVSKSSSTKPIKRREKGASLLPSLQSTSVARLLPGALLPACLQGISVRKKRQGTCAAARACAPGAPWLAGRSSSSSNRSCRNEHSQRYHELQCLLARTQAAALRQFLFKLTSWRCRSAVSPAAFEGGASGQLARSGQRLREEGSMPEREHLRHPYCRLCRYLCVRPSLRSASTKQRDI